MYREVMKFACTYSLSWNKYIECYDSVTPIHDTEIVLCIKSTNIVKGLYLFLKMRVIISQI